MAFVFEHDTRGELVLDAKHGYVLERPAGIDALTATFQEGRNFTQFGTSVGSITLPHRIVNISGVIVGQEQDRKRDDLIKFFCAGAKGKLKFNGYYLSCYVQTSPTFSSRPFNSKFSLALIAPDPRWIAESTTSAQLIWDGAFWSAAIENDSDYNVPWELKIDLTSGSISQFSVFRSLPDGNFESCNFQFDPVTAPAVLTIFIKGSSAILSVEKDSITTDYGECLSYQSTFTEFTPGEHNLSLFPTAYGTINYTAQIDYYKTRGGM